MSIFISKKEVIILAGNLDEPKNYLNFFATILFFIKQNIPIKSIFGLFTGVNIDMTRKRAKIEFLNNLNHSNFIYMLEGDNIEAYYNNSNITEKPLGIEFRFSNETDFYKKKENILIEIVREIGEQKRIAFGKNV